MRNWQIISRMGFNLDFQKSVTPEEALRKYAIKQGFNNYKGGIGKEIWRGMGRTHQVD